MLRIFGWWKWNGFLPGHNAKGRSRATASAALYFGGTGLKSATVKEEARATPRRPVQRWMERTEERWRQSRAGMKRKARHGAAGFSETENPPQRNPWPQHEPRGAPELWGASKLFTEKAKKKNTVTREGLSALAMLSLQEEKTADWEDFKQGRIFLLLIWSLRFMLLSCWVCAKKRLQTPIRTTIEGAAPFSSSDTPSLILWIQKRLSGLILRLTHSQWARTPKAEDTLGSAGGSRMGRQIRK